MMARYSAGEILFYLIENLKSEVLYLVQQYFYD